MFLREMFHVEPKQNNKKLPVDIDSIGENEAFLHEGFYNIEELQVIIGLLIASEHAETLH